MKKVKKIRIIPLDKNAKAWKIYQQFGAFNAGLNRQQDARQLKRGNQQSAPLDLIVMLF